MTHPAPGLILLLLLLIAPACRAGEVVVDARVFRVPDGFVVEKVAGPPLVDRPIVADFDDRGRLYVADSSGSNARVQVQAADRPHRIVRLEDVDGDGTFDRSTVFADKMMFPEGAMWLGGSLYVAAPPSIWKLTDDDGDGVADRREEWFRGKTLTGCANDLHGPYAGPDGRIYWTKGAFAPQTYDRPGRKPLQTRAAHIFRARADGTEVEPVMTGGMDNPVDVAFTAEGERIFTTTFLQHPGGGRRDGLIHALYGGVYGKDHDVIEGHPRTGPGLLEPLAHLGPAAPSGLCVAESDALGIRGDLFAACFNLRKVTRHRLTPRGATFDSRDDDFIAADDLDFHPTDVQEDADGSLLVVDTGGWYKICCPTSQLVKPDVLGAIYRVRRRDAPKVDDPRGLRLAWDAMPPDAVAGHLADPRPAVRRRARELLGRAGEPGASAALKMIREGADPEARRGAVWAACRTDSPGARLAVRVALDDLDPTVRHASAHAAGLWRDEGAAGRLAEMVGSDAPGPARAAAEALGRIGRRPGADAALLRAADTADPALRHSATFALIESGDPEAIRLGLDSPSPLTRRAAMMALDQRDGGGLEAGPVVGSLGSTDPGLRNAAWWLAARHPEWGDAVAGFLRARLGAGPVDEAELEARVGSMAGARPVGDLIAATLADPSTPSPRALLLLRAMARAGVKDVPPGWPGAVASALSGDDPATIRQAVATARTLPVDPGSANLLTPALLRVARRDDAPAEVRLGALAGVPGGLARLGRVDPDLFEFLRDRLRPERPAADRMLAADVLARAGLSDAQVIALTGSVAEAGPLELPRLLDAFDGRRDEGVGRSLIEALGRSPARSTLRPGELRPRLARFGPGLAREAEALCRSIEAGSSDRSGHLETLLGQLRGGDVRRGQAIFNGPKAACVTCHAIGYVGGTLGPDLTRIGAVRGERDLLESIAYPSVSFVRSYEPVSVATRGGRVVSGILRKDAPDEVAIAVTADRVERIPRDQVEEMAPGTVSTMPAGIDRLLTTGELADLIAFLKACR